VLRAHVTGCTGRPPTFGCPGCLRQRDEPAPDERTLRRARTATSRATLAAGIHPATGAQLDYDHTCGECAHCLLVTFAGGTTWRKCELHRHGQHGADTDIRASWPACVKFIHCASTVP